MRLVLLMGCGLIQNASHGDQSDDRAGRVSGGGAGETSLGWENAQVFASGLYL